MTPLATVTVSFFWHFIKRAAAVLAVLGILWFIYLTVFKPHINPVPTESQSAKKIDNYNFELAPKQTFFGCANYRIQNPKELIEPKQ
jgi:hypothetical protein